MCAGQVGVPGTGTQSEQEVESGPLLTLRWRKTESKQGSATSRGGLCFEEK